MARFFKRYNSYELDDHLLIKKTCKTTYISTTNDPSREKTNNVVSEQVRHKSDCTVTEDG